MNRVRLLLSTWVLGPALALSGTAPCSTLQGFAQSKGFAAREAQRPDDLLVVINAGSGINALTQEEVIALFMGRQKRLASGQLAFPVEPVDDVAQRTRFYELLMHANLTQIRSYWARMWFSGQAQPPLQTRTSAEVIELVRSNPGAIGFVERSQLGPGVKAVLVLRAKGGP